MSRSGTLRHSRKPPLILQHTYGKSPTWDPTLKALTLSPTTSIPQVSMLALLVSPSVLLHSRRRKRFFSHSRVGHQVYDWLILLDREVDHVWRSEWSVAKILFIIARYGALLDTPIFITSESGSTLVRGWNAAKC